MNGALLSEVWPDMVKNPKKAKRLKNKNNDDPVMNPPLTPNEMETELLGDNNNEELNPERRLMGMRVSPYTSNEVQYQNMRKREEEDRNENIQHAESQRSIKREKAVTEYSEDPEYLEFLEFKRRKYTRTTFKDREPSTESSSSPDEQFHELLLYIFTGFFLLMIYDNIYKLGKDSY